MKLWGGMFSKEINKAADEFNSSLSFDARLYKYDITGSIAHARMLGKCGILEKAEADLIISALQDILKDISSGDIVIKDAEDIHTFIENTLVSRIGAAGKKLHTARSRNDQVSLDIRMYLREKASDAILKLADLCKLLTANACGNLDTIMPGYTHLQHAQPITLAHHMMAYFQMFRRDIERLAECRKRINIMPLGSGALAGTTFPIDREAVAAELGFEKITSNSLDGVSDRDFVIEILSCISIIMMHLSRFCEELVLWSSSEFGFVVMDDSFSTGSSIMPQKKNPDMAELIRGKTGRAYGNLITVLTVMKSLPLAYNKDMQEDKEAVFDAVETMLNCLGVFSGMLASARFNKGKMYNAAHEGYANATDAADYLAAKGVPFREAHEIAGKMVLYCISKKKPLDSLTDDELAGFSSLYGSDAREKLSLRCCIDSRSTPGGPSPASVKLQIKEAQSFIDTIISTKPQTWPQT